MRKVLSKIVSGSTAALLIFVAAPVSAANTPTFNQTINAGILTTDILDATRTPVALPAVAMSAKSFSFDCQFGGNASSGTLGSNAQRVYVSNPGAANNGWTLTMAATTGATSLWGNTGATQTFDFNDPTGSGCTDGADADSKGGQMTVNASAGTLTADCSTCTTANVTRGSSASFSQGSTDAITLLNAAAASDDSWRGYLTGATVAQNIPAEQPADAYTLNMTLTATAL